MEPDKRALAERITRDLHLALRRASRLSTFDIVPVDSNFRNKSPVLHIENCLGLESWCVKHVYMISYSELMDTCFAKPKRKTAKITSVNSEKIVKLLNVVLLINPDLSTLWNKRRELVLKGLLEAREELGFTRLVLSRKAKSNDAFSYRRWIWDHLLNDNTLTPNLDNLVTEELRVCEVASDKCPNNYHSWSHRMWLLKRLRTADANIDLNLVYISEYVFSEQCTSKHISDFSCFHYRQFCIENIFNLDRDSHWNEFEKHVSGNMRRNTVKIIGENFPKNTNVQASAEDVVSYSYETLVILLLGKALNGCQCESRYSDFGRKIEILLYELTLNDEMIRFYKQHETLWYHRRYIIHEILSLIYNYYGVSRKSIKISNNACAKCLFTDSYEKGAKQNRYDSDVMFSSCLFVVLISCDRKFIVERRLDGDNYADRHEKYVKFIEGVDLKQ